MAEVDRRHVLGALGVGLMTTGHAFAAASRSQEIAQRLAQAQQEGKVYGLHTLLVSQGGKLIIEHYGQGEDEAWETRSAPSPLAPTCCTICALFPRASWAWSMVLRSRPARCRPPRQSFTTSSPN